MHYKKVLFISALMAALALFGFGSQAWAGGPENNAPGTGNIGGPELWGEIVYDSNAGVASLRVKRIVDCNVETQAVLSPNWNLGSITDAQAQLINLKLGVTLFNINQDPSNPEAIITKVKNFKEEGTTGLYSWDAQIKFWTP